MVRIWHFHCHGPGSIPDQESEMPQAMQCEKEKKTRKKTTNKTEVNNLPEGFPGGAVVKNLPASAGDTGSSPGPGRSHMPWSN